jgi:flagellar assembly protein FliH
MSLSRIIRNGAEPQLPFSLAPLGQALPPLEPDGFRAVALGCPGEQAAEPFEEEPPPPACIPEQEALARIRQAHAEGVAQGRGEARGELAAAGQALARALEATAALRPQLMHEAEEDLLRLSVLIARKVMLREFSCDPGILAGLVRGALELANEPGEIVLRLNADEYQVVAECGEFRELLKENRSLTLKSDPALPPAGCLLETARGNIDAGLDAQLDDILRRLCEERCARREEPGDD